MKERMFGLLTALALCLALLPGAALAEGETGVTIGSVSLVAGTKYVADETNGGVKATGEGETPSDYLTYDGSTLTVTGTVALTGTVTVNSSLEITGGAGSSLSVTNSSGPSFVLTNGNTLTLGGNVNFTAVNSTYASFGTTSDGAASTLAATDSYSGNISITSNIENVVLDVQNSGSFTVTGSITYPSDPPREPMRLISKTGDITITNGVVNWPTVTLEGKNVSIADCGVFTAFVGDSLTINAAENVTIGDEDSSAAIRSSAVISAGGSVQILSGGAPVQAWNADSSASLTVTGAERVDITGASKSSKPFFSVPVKFENCETVTVTDNGDGDFLGEGGSIDSAVPIHLGGTASEAENYIKGGTLNTIVHRVTDGGQKNSFTVYGKANLPFDISLRDGSNFLTIPQGAELTIPNGKRLEIKELGQFVNQGSVVNNGTVTLAGNAAQSADISQTIKSLGLTGTGTVTVQKTGSDMETYTNSGVRQLAPAGTLDLSGASTDETNWETKGYKWVDVEKDGSDNIIKGTLVLAEGFNATKVTLPGNGGAVTVKAEGDCLIGELDYKGYTSSTSIQLTFEGGKLTVNKHINFSGDVRSSVTIAGGAVLEANGGITVAAAAGVDGAITVNGTLTAKGEGEGAAVLTGKVSVGSSGKLEVSGKTGVQLGGWSIEDDPDNIDFAGAFTVQPGGLFEARCNPTIILASAGFVTIRETTETEVIVVPDGYLPSDLVLEFKEGRKELVIPGDGSLFKIAQPPAPPTPPTPPAHTHKWAAGWTTSETHHWHECTASGCKVTEDRQKDGYGEHVYDGDQDAICNVCGYVRLLLKPTEPSGGDASNGDTSGGDSSGDDSSGGFFPGVFFPGGGKRASAVSGGPAAVWAALAALEEQACPSRAFSDLDAGAWYHEATDLVLWAGLMNGYSDGTFRPGGTVSRAMLAQILYNQAGKPAVTGGKTFSDVAPGAWYAPAVAWAAERGIADGYADGTFRPNGGITREQLAVMLWRYAGSPASNRALTFTDTDRAGDYALAALRWAVERGVMSGKSGGVLDPQGPATRAQTAQMLKNLLKD